MIPPPESGAGRHGRSRPRLRLLIVAALLLLGWLLWPGHHRDTAEAAPRKAGTPVPVHVAPTRRADVPVFLQGLGNVQAFYTVTLRARVDGELQRLGFTEGQTVAKGAFLAQIDPRPYRAALEQAQAAQAKDRALLDNARRDLRRYETLAPRDLTSRQTLDSQRALVAQLEAQLKGDRATIDAAQTQLDYTRITAPIAGRTGLRLVDPGNIVHASDSTGIVVITQLQPISVVFTLPEDQLLAVNAALAQGPVAVTATPRDSTVKLDEGTLTLVDNQIDPSTGTLRLKATFPNPRHALWPGEFVSVRLRLRTDAQALIVPSAALQNGPDGSFVYIVGADSTVQTRAVQLGAEDGDSVVVEKGLADGDRVVTSNQYRLEPGSAVHVLGASDDGSPP